MKIRFLLCIVLISFFVFGPTGVLASDLSNAQADRAKLEAELANLEKDIAAKQKQLDKQKGKSATLSGDIKLLTSQIEKSKKEIQAKNLVIQKLGGEIVQKNKKIQTLTEKIESEKQTLAQLVRKSREIDDKSVVSFVLSGESISDVYGEFDKFMALSDSIGDSVGVIRHARNETESEKKNLEIQKDKQLDVKVELENTKKKVEQNEKDKKQLLSISKNKEAEYQKVLAEKAKRKSEILTALFGLRDTGAIPFSKALEYANLASEKTGVRAAFVLGILTQESNLGTDQGSCYVTDINTGTGVSSRSGKIFKNVMKPTRDVKPFFEITQSVGRDPYKTLVSCPIGGFGYGGAMGPAQFIPSTWMILKSRIASALGISNPDPWYARDAFMASAMYLADLGANKGGYTAERNAACKYYSGRSCGLVTGNTSYGNSVMTKTAKIQSNIDLLQN
ncbi:MAG: lytic murein transglycosylase [Candidatus Pacebacteria bacterium]|nr:lytic murein transglycosylase [Candidatus Paceibacterota bacterium]MBP9715769.1 lytic murein transglycosylase [Candidatus Paceibacterota bacterium]